MQKTLCLIIDGNRVLLGMKKRGFGAGKYNGFGGKQEEGESIEEAAIREVEEEAGVKVTNLENRGNIIFTFPQKPEWKQQVHLFVAKMYTGEPTESEEMTVEWFDLNALQLDKMWKTDTHWMPYLLQGKTIEATFTFADDNESVKDYNINEI